MQICIHRGANEIGGTCIQLSTNKTSILLDIGTPLKKESINIDLSKIDADAILISHPHQDHYGLINTIDSPIPIYIGEVAKNLINFTSMILGKNIPINNFNPIKRDNPFTVGDIKITPYLVDHSAVDAFAFLIQAEDKNIFYSGDFRAHGRKAGLFHELVENPPENIDLLFMEGTMIDRKNDKFPDEAAVEERITETLKDQKNISFMISSSHNIDRIVSAYRACLKTEKVFIIDLYTALILEQLKIISDHVPNMEWDNIRIYADYRQDLALKNNESLIGEFRKRVYKYRIRKEEIAKDPSKYLYFSKMSKFKIMNLYKKAEDNPVNVIYSQWPGYLKMSNKEYFGAEEISAYENDKNVNFVYAHTSGHATTEDLKKYAAAINPKAIVPIHTEYKNKYKELFDNVELHDDGECWEV